jgi:hypothetical protein
MQRSVPSSRRRLTWAPALAAAVVAGALAGCSSSPQASTTTRQTSTTPAPASSTSRPVTTSTPATSTTELAPQNDAAIEAAWAASINDFYGASEHDSPSSPALLATLFPGSPELRQETDYIEEQSASGVAGPSSWRLGNISVVSRSASVATVSACSYDPGSHYVSTGAVAPADLGGGAGYTGYIATMRAHGGKWLLYATTVSSPTSSEEAGPCHGF